MRRIQRYHLLAVLGDLKPKSYNDTVMIGTLHFADPTQRAELWPGENLSTYTYYSDIFESMLKRLIEDGLIKRVETSRIRFFRTLDSYQISSRDYELQLTD